MRLARFMVEEIEPIMVGWDEFARTCIPAAATMSATALSDHAEIILRAIAADMDTPQSEAERSAKSRGLAVPLDARHTAATVHGALRHLDGFDLTQVVAEFRALRATVLRMWGSYRPSRIEDIEDIARFNEGIDQALAESISAYSAKIDESRDTFLAVLGHDLRGPLSAVSNCVHLLQRDKLAPAKSERMLAIATRSVACMSGLITDLLEYTRTRLGRGIEVDLKEDNFATVCFEAIEEARAGHAGRTFNFASPVVVTVMFDADRMRQVIGNLLNNAVQHGEVGSPVEIGLSNDHSHVQLTVANRGKPIPAEALQVIFNPLVQVATAPTELHERPSTSMGLGLFIAREIVEAHAGTIGVTSSAANGTVFTVRLPKYSTAARAKLVGRGLNAVVGA